MITTLNRLASLVGLVIVAWLSIVFGLFTVFRIIFEATLPPQITFTPTILGVTRILVGAAVTASWLLIWRRLAERYFWGKLKGRH